MLVKKMATPVQSKPEVEEEKKEEPVAPIEACFKP